MATWGYRVYTFKLIAGRNEPLVQDIEEHRLWLLNALEAVGNQTRIGKPLRSTSEIEESDEDLTEEIPAGDYESTQPTLTLRGCAYSRDLSAIHASIALGEQGLHDFAINPDNGTDRLDVKNRSAETPRRTDFYFASSGLEGIIVTEVVAMKDPIPLLRRWVRYCSVQERRSKLRAIDEKYLTINSDTHTGTKSQAIAAVRKSIGLQVDRVADPGLLSEILDDIQSMDTEYVETDERSKTIKKRLIVKVNSQRVQRSVVDLLRSGVEGRSIIRQTLESLEMDPERLTAATIEPTSMKAHVKSTKGSTTLVPGAISELFNYSFSGSGKPGHTPYYETTLKKVDALKRSAQVSLDQPLPSDMVEWVETEEESWR